MHVATYSAFKEELEKLSVSDEWVESKVEGSKASPEKLKKFEGKMWERHERLGKKFNKAYGTPFTPRKNWNERSLGALRDRASTAAISASRKLHSLAKHAEYFQEELEKLGFHAGAELAGLGLLAAPTAVKHFGGKEWSEKNKRRAELGGLGILAAPAAHTAYKAIRKGGLSALKHASAEPGLADGALSLFKEAQGLGQVAGSFGAGTGKLLHDTARRAVAGGGKSLAERVAARRSQMMQIARKANPVTTLPSSGKVIHASIDKEAFLKSLMGATAQPAKAVFKPAFKGHAAAVKGLSGTTVGKSGIETVKNYNPFAQTVSKSRSISIPGLT